MVNMAQEKPAPHRRINRSTTHIRIKWSVKHSLEAYAKKHHCATYSQAIRKLLENSDSPKLIKLTIKKDSGDC